MQKRKISVQQVIPKIFIGVFISIIGFISLFPFVWVLYASFQSNADIIVGSFGFSNGIQFANYPKAFRLAPIGQFFFNSVIVSLCGTALNLVVTAMAAYVIARFRYPLNGILKFAFASILFIPCAALLQPLYTTMNAVGLYDTRRALIIVYAGLGMATSFYIMLSYYNTIPRSMEEAAYIDGAGFTRTFLTIILPLSKPCFATAGVLQFLLCWNEFQFSLTLATGAQSRTLPIALYYFTSQFASDYGAMFAATVIIALPTILVYCMLQKQVIAGLVSGAVKE